MLPVTPIPPVTINAPVPFDIDGVVFDIINWFGIVPPEKPPVDANVMVLLVPTVVIVIPEPATNVNIPVGVFAITLGWPETRMVEKLFDEAPPPPPPAVVCVVPSAKVIWPPPPGVSLKLFVTKVLLDV